MSEYRALGALSDDQLRVVANRLALGELRGVSPLRGGAVGNNVALSTDKGEWVLRGAVRNVTVESLRKERFFARAINEACSLAAPWPYLIDARTDIFGWPYAVMSRLSGESLHYQADLDWTAVGAELGRATAELSSVTFDDCGSWQSEVDDIVPITNSAADWFSNRVTDLMRCIAETSTPLDDTSVRFVEEAVEAALPTIRDFQPSYVHGDLGLGNFAAEHDQRGITFTGVFDLGGGYAGNPEENMATSLWWPLYWGRPVAASAFLAGHRAARKPRPDQNSRLRAHVIAAMLTNWEVGQRENYRWYRGAETFYEWAAPLVAQVDRIVAG